MKAGRKQRGAILTEYMLLALLIAILLIAGVSRFGDGVTSLLRSSADTVEEETGS